MRVFYVFILLFSITITSYGQIKFKQGYFINNEDELIKCLIKDKAWFKNPKKFHYKLSEDGASESRSIDNTKEFCVDSSLKYIRADVDIDMSPTDIDKLSRVSYPLWEQKRVFLKVLVEGDAKLYYYHNGIFERFFYSLNDTSIQQLICKEYLYKTDKREQYYEPDIKRAYNNDFRLQLLKRVRCPKTDRNSVMNLSYHEKELVKYFHQYNACVDSTYVIPKRTHKNLDFNVGVFSGFYISSVAATDALYSFRNVNFDPQLNYSLGMEMEFILPFNNKKLSFTIESFYKPYQSQKETSGAFTTMDFSSINMAAGFKYYLFLNSNGKFFLDIHMNYPVFVDKSAKLTSSSWYTNTHLHYPIKKTPHYITLGGGFQYKDLYTALRINPYQAIFPHPGRWKVVYKSISFVLGYKLIRTKPAHSN